MLTNTDSMFETPEPTTTDDDEPTMEERTTTLLADLISRIAKGEIDVHSVSQSRNPHHLTAGPGQRRLVVGPTTLKIEYDE